MVLELKVPHGEDFSALEPLLPIFLSDVLSFVNVGIYWNNLHNMFHTVQRVDGRVLWANLNLLFWLSLMPATTAFMGENHFAPVPVAVYGARPCTLCGRLRHSRRQCCTACTAVTQLSPGRWAVTVRERSRWASTSPRFRLTFVNQWIAVALYVLVAMVWLVPDTRFERLIEK